MDGNELSSFLIDKPEQIQNLINEFEMNNELREKGFLSLDGMFIFLIKQKKQIEFSMKAFEICYYPKILILLIRFVLVRYIKT